MISSSGKIKAMKFSQILYRAGLGLVLGFALSFLSSALTFDYSGYGSIDRAFLFIVPALAIAFLFFISFPKILQWMEQARQNQRVVIALPHYIIGFLFSAMLAYGSAGFLHEVLAESFIVFLFTAIFVSTSSVATYYLIRRAAHSFQNGFLHKPINFILSFSLPVLLIVITIISAEFLSMFRWEYISIPKNLAGGYFAGILIASMAGIFALNKFDYEAFRATRIFPFIKENLAGLYAGGMFFLVNLILARALNHPALGYNSVLFETDAGPWMNILASPQSDSINRAVHPLSLLIARPLMRVLGIFMGEHWNLAGILIVALLSGLCVFMAYLFVNRATGAETYAFLFAIFLGSTSTHLLFGSLTENYVFGMTSLIFFFLLIQAGEMRLSRLVPLGVIVFGITITNIAQTAIGLFFNKLGFWKVVRYCFFVVTFGVALTMLVSVAYPNAETFFFVPADIAFEGNFVKPTYDSPLASVKEKFQVAARTMFLYEVVAPEPLIVVSQKKSDPFPTVDLKTYDWREHKLASYKGAGNIPLVIWLALLGGAFLLFVKNARRSKNLPLSLGLLGILGFNFLMHNFYGAELFLYTPYWVYALVFFIALAYEEFTDNKLFEILFAFFVLMLMVNNARFIFIVLRALAPFFAAR